MFPGYSVVRLTPVRHFANATFHESRATDAATRVDYALDPSPLIGEDGLPVEAFLNSVLEAIADLP